MPTRITAANIAPGAITADRLAEGAGGGPRITNIQVTDDAYTVIDDTAVSLSGGYVKITGTGFQTGCVAIIGSTTATATAFVSSNFINVQVPALAAGTYIVYVVNPDGAVAIRVNGLTYSATPTWITGSTLPEIGVDDQISIQLSASSNSTVTYDLEAGSTLPPGLSLSAQGLLTGSVTGLEDDTVYSFTVVAQDAENQDSPRSFSITVVVGDPYFYLTTLLLNGDGVNAAQNNSFIDSSTNNYSMTRNGNVTQGTFSPFSQSEGRWSAYFDGTGDGLNAGSQSAYAFGTGPFCIEFWVYNTALKNYSCGVTTRPDNGSYADAYHIGWDSVGGVSLYINTTSNPSGASGTMKVGQWQHFVCCRDGSNVTSIFVNGTRVGTATITANFTRQLLGIGDFPTTPAESVQGYLSNVRLVKGSSVYDPTQTTITVPTSPLTAVSGTSLLTCQSNRFKDNSANNFAITRNGDASVQPISPYPPAGKYLPAVNGGSGYFDGTGDYLAMGNSSAFAFTGATDWTVECWIYPTHAPADAYRGIFAQNASTGFRWGIYGSGSAPYLTVLNGGGGVGTMNLAAPNNVIRMNQWQHIALVNTGGTLRQYHNGVALGSAASANYTTTGTATIGSWGTTLFFQGYMSGFRITQGAAIYTSAFTPPTAPITTTANTALLVEYTNGGIVDLTGRNNLETVGNAQISTSIKNYGTGSLAFDGSGDYLVTPPSDLIPFLTGDFTVEVWAYPINGGKGSSFSRLVNIGSGNVAGALTLNTFSTDSPTRIEAILWSGNDTTSIVLNSQDTIPNSVWTHIAFTRSGTTCRLFINGVLKHSGTSSQSVTQNVLYVGSRAASEYFNGYLDDLRITRGFARYTANFTPPTAAHRLR